MKLFSSKYIVITERHAMCMERIALRAIGLLKIKMRLR